MILDVAAGENPAVAVLDAAAIKPSVEAFVADLIEIAHKPSAIDEYWAIMSQGRGPAQFGSTRVRKCCGCDGQVGGVIATFEVCEHCNELVRKSCMALCEEEHAVM